jgi:hypothetical protein
MRKLLAPVLLFAALGCSGSDTLPSAEVFYPPNVDPIYLPGSTFDFVSPEARAAADPVVYAFALWGCNRISFGDVANVPWKSTANEPWLAQMMEDVRAMPSIDPTISTVPHLFFTGDLVLNEEDDRAKTLREQMSAWAPFFQSQPLWQGGSNLPFLMLGNHEALVSKEVSPGVYNEFLPDTQDNLSTWLEILRAHRFFVPPANSSAPGVHKSAAGAMDKVDSSLEAYASYSFDMGDIHFVVLNTDTYTGDMDGENRAIGWVQTEWLDQDLTRAEKTADLIFVFGHKPAVAFPGSGTEGQKGDLHVNDDIQQRFIEVLNRHEKVVGYFTAHAHGWDTQILESPGIAKKTMQLVAGNGGSILQDSWQPAGGTYFGPTIVKVTRSGRVVATSYGRPAPNPIYTPPTGPLTKREEHQVYPLPAG